MDVAFLIASAALAASTLAAVAGTGGGVILLPVLVSVFGAREAVSIYTAAQLCGNLSRVVLNRQAIQPVVVFWFCCGAIPCSFLGAWLFARLPDSKLTAILGAFLIASVAWRHLFKYSATGFQTPWFMPIGAAFSVVSALVGSAGPFLAPFYLSYGLVKGAFIGTEALGTSMVHISKLLAYQGLNATTTNTWLVGLLTGPVMILGSLIGKRWLAEMSVSMFTCLIDAMIAGFGLWFLIQ
ncbi:sulfite exporter TauE/SafE family protein [Methylomarinum sp. Ch1-1]|uniref:Probable membrane transporter protein n=1 Tax=Methylomarinum roseum TaxID=3067653 RepID=A0AAU7NQV6_9GAMM|nr:sulfite exporter TauE/SafE family protein [Methylomarinum sp. Ch1-1]MDP4520659.1 sulfite exporter TauE/SafE family protein [Methylomarinum sp. Ch1-1]